MMPGFGWKPSPVDPHDYPPSRIFAMIEAGTVTPVSWTDPVWLNQGETQHCVGFAGAGFIATANATMGTDATVTNALGDELYYAAKVIDGEPKQEDGSCSRSLAKVLKQRGVIAAYSLTADILAIEQFMAKGPVVFGLPWYQSMMQKDADGFIRLDPMSSIAGGHEILGRAEDTGDIVLRNSWGEAWGECKVSLGDIKELLAQGGDCLLMVKQAAAPFPAPKPPKPVHRRPHRHVQHAK